MQPLQSGKTIRIAVSTVMDGRNGRILIPSEFVLKRKGFSNKVWETALGVPERKYGRRVPKEVRQMGILSCGDLKEEEGVCRLATTKRELRVYSI